MARTRKTIVTVDEQVSKRQKLVHKPITVIALKEAQTPPIVFKINRYRFIIIIF